MSHEFRSTMPHAIQNQHHTNFQHADISQLCASTDNDRCLTIEKAIFDELENVIDPELGRSLVDLGMITSIAVSSRLQDNELQHDDDGVDLYDAHIDMEITVSGCPLSQQLLDMVTQAVILCSTSYAKVIPQVSITTMSSEKLSDLMKRLKESRHDNPFLHPTCRTKIFAIASGKGGVGKSSVTANLAATFAALGYKTAVIDADIYGFSIPTLFGIQSQPTNLDGMLMPVKAWGVNIMSIGMFAGSQNAILWRGPRLQRSLQQFLSDVWWDDPDVLLLDLPPGTGDMPISVAQFLPSAQTVVVTTPQRSAATIAARSGLMSLQLPGHVCGVIENMSWYDYQGDRLYLFGQGGGQQVADHLTRDLGYDVPLLGQIPLENDVRQKGETGHPAVLDDSGHLTQSLIAQTFCSIASSLLHEDQ